MCITNLDNKVLLVIMEIIAFLFCCPIFGNFKLGWAAMFEGLKCQNWKFDPPPD